MKLSLLFLESLKKQIKKLLKTYPSLDETTIRLLNSADPTGDEAKYTKWLTQQYIKGNINLDDGFTKRPEIYDKLAIFDKNPWKFPSNDIYKLDVKDLFETKAISDSKIDYSELLQPPNRLLKEINNYKLIEINAYQGMEQFKRESDTVPAQWCVAYPKRFKQYGPPMYLTIKNEEPYVMILYHKDELKDRDNNPITFDVFKELLNIGFIDVNRLEFTGDSEEFANYFLQKYGNFNELLKLDNPKLLAYYLKKDPSVKNKVANIILNKNDYEAAKIYSESIQDKQYKLFKKIIIKNHNDIKQAYWYAKNVLKSRWELVEKMIIDNNDLDYAYKYARDVVKDKWIPAEKIIINSNNLNYAYEYALNIIKGRWEPIEEMIIHSNNVEYAYWYTKDVLHTRWPPAEEIIINSKNMEFIMMYAARIIKGKWPLAEKILIRTKDPEWASLYAIDVLHNRWKPAEEIIINSKNPEWAYLYAIGVIDGRWEPAEKIITDSNDPEHAYLYAFHIMKHRWPQAEKIILKSKNYTYIYKYATNIIKNRWPEAEPILKQDKYWWSDYQRFLEKLQK